MKSIIAAGILLGALHGATAPATQVLTLKVKLIHWN